MLDVALDAECSCCFLDLVLKRHRFCQKLRFSALMALDRNQYDLGYCATPFLRIGYNSSVRLGGVFTPAFHQAESSRRRQSKEIF